MAVKDGIGPGAVFKVQGEIHVFLIRYHAGVFLVCSGIHFPRRVENLESAVMLKREIDVLRRIHIVHDIGAGDFTGQVIPGLYQGDRSHGAYDYQEDYDQYLYCFPFHGFPPLPFEIRVWDLSIGIYMIYDYVFLCK